MSRAIEVWLNDEAEEALAILCAAGAQETAAINTALVEAAAHADLRPMIDDPVAVGSLLEKSHDVVAEILATQRPR